MRKRIVGQPEDAAGKIDAHLPIELIAEVEVTSELPDYPVDAALHSGIHHGWRASTPGEQRLTIIFDQPEVVRKLTLKFVETERPRTHEFVLTWSSQIGGLAHIIVRQQWTFSPAGSTTESETYSVHLRDVRMLELMIKPDLTDPEAVASLREWRMYGNI